MRLAALLLSAVVLLASGGAARADENEKGPNFELPAGLSSDVAAQYRRGLAAYEAAHAAKSGQTEKLNVAIKELKRSRDLAPKLAQPCYYLGILYQWTQEFEKARGILVKACELNPSFHQAVVELGDTYCWLKQVEKGIAEYDRAIAMRPDYAHAYAMRGLARLRIGDFKAAAGDFEEGKRILALQRPPRPGGPKAPTGTAVPAPTTATAGPTAPTGTAEEGTSIRDEDDDELDGDEPWLERGLKMARKELDGPGWKTTYTCETDHYRVMTPVSQELADELGKHAELIFSAYTKIFPKIDKTRRKFTILIYASRDDYIAAGSPKSAAGHYEPSVRKLVLYRQEKPDPSKPAPADPLADTKLVLYHEGFHQFLHDYLERAPQWFNEGLGDFFGASKYVEGPKGSKGGMRLLPNPWRLKHIQSSIQAKKVRRFRELMLMSQRELYDPQWIGIHYAQSWSIIYFLIRGGAGGRETAGPYFKLLQDYFKALRRGDGQESAFEAAFGRCDLNKLEEEWRRFTLGLTPNG